jgi:hypothetical protein
VEAYSLLFTWLAWFLGACVVLQAACAAGGWHLLSLDVYMAVTLLLHWFWQPVVCVNRSRPDQHAAVAAAVTAVVAIRCCTCLLMTWTR